MWGEFPLRTFDLGNVVDEIGEYYIHWWKVTEIGLQRH
jgi:hypothetical protein